ncbi:MAG TPA: hypothetical protein DFS52_14030 [Myxococcales bacterium]|nr:hypothetical protein [Myxococcales bacterium]
MRASLCSIGRPDRAPLAVVRSVFALLLVALGSSCSPDRFTSNEGALSSEPSAIDFGRVLVGAEARAELRLLNAGRSGMTVFARAETAAVSVSPARFEIAAQGEVRLTLTFQPAAAGKHSGFLDFTSDAGARLRVPVDGTGVTEALGLPEELHFGPVRVGESARMLLPVTSLSNQPLSARLSIGGEDRTAFSSSEQRIDLPPRGGAQVELQMTPHRAGDLTASLELAFCGGCPSARVTLRGLGLRSALVPRPERLDFGSVPPGLSSSRVVSLVNFGNTPVRLSGANLATAANFRFDSTPLPALVQAGASLDIRVTFAPADLGKRESALRFVGDQGHVLFEVPLSGRGARRKVSVTPAALDFGTLAVGMPVTRQVVVRPAPGTGSVGIVQVAAAGLDGASAYRSMSALLPHDVATSPLWISLTLTAELECALAGELVIATNDAEEPEVRVPIVGRAVATPACELELRPTELRFGLVHAGSRAVRAVDLVNVGSGACLVAGAQLAPDGAGTFALVEALDAEIAPGDARSFSVSYAPEVARATLDRGRLLFSQSGLADLRAVPVSGMATELDLWAEPGVVEFGAVRLGEVERRSLLLGNRGAVEVEIDQAGLTRASSDRFTVLSPSVGTLHPGLPISIGLEFGPVALGRHRGQVELWVVGEPEPLLVDLEGTGSGEPCTEGCARPVAACPSAQAALVASTVLLEGSGAHPEDAPLHCAWRVVEAPDGSRAVPVTAAGSCAATFTPELVGPYALALTVTDPAGASDTCTTALTARAPGGLWVELVWDLPSDVDLHLLHPSAGPAHERSSWSRAPFDCYFGNMQPSWDLPGPRDDPRLDRDDVAQVGAENIQILEPSLAHPYTVGIAWFANHFGHPEMRATANIYCGGELAAREAATLHDVGEIAVVGEVRLDSPTRCSFSAGGAHLLPAH